VATSEYGYSACADETAKAVKLSQIQFSNSPPYKNGRDLPRLFARVYLKRPCPLEDQEGPRGMRRFFSMHPQPRVEENPNTSVSPRSHGTTRLPRNGFTAYLRASPRVDNGLFEPSPCAAYRRLTPASGRVRNDTTWPYAVSTIRSNALQGHAYRPRVMTLRNAPMTGRDQNRCECDLPTVVQ